MCCQTLKIDDLGKVEIVRKIKNTEIENNLKIKIKVW